MIGGLAGFGLTVAFGYALWSVEFFILSIIGFLVGFGVVIAKFDDFIMGRIAGEDREKHGRSVNCHHIKETEWEGFLASLKRV